MGLKATAKDVKVLSYDSNIGKDNKVYGNGILYSEMDNETLLIKVRNNEKADQDLKNMRGMVCDVELDVANTGNQGFFVNVSKVNANGVHK